MIGGHALLLSHCLSYLSILFFFFSSRRRHTRSKRDWSSDVCSSDLGVHLHDLRFLSGGGGPLAAGLLADDAAAAGSGVRHHHQEIGRASCRERVEISVVAV